MSRSPESDNLRRHKALWERRGATSTEYIAILALVVLPIGLLLPMFLNMVQLYATRLLSWMGLPFP